MLFSFVNKQYLVPGKAVYHARVNAAPFFQCSLSVFSFIWSALSSTHRTHRYLFTVVALLRAITPGITSIDVCRRPPQLKTTLPRTSMVTEQFGEQWGYTITPCITPVRKLLATL